MERNMTYFVSLVILFLIIPFLPARLLTATDNIIVRAFLLMFVIILAMDRPLLGVMALLVVGLIFIERNKISIARAYTSHADLFKIDTENEALKVLEVPTPAPIQPVYESPAMTVHPFGPGADSGSDAFEAIDTSIDQKFLIPSASVRGAESVKAQLYSDEREIRMDSMARDLEDKYADA
jgi:hypothetical protein